MVGNFSTTANGTQLTPSSCFLLGHLLAERIAKYFVYCLIFAISLAGNTYIGILVYKTKNMRKNINFLIVNMAMSDLLFPIFVVPWYLTLLNFNYWPMGGALGGAICKLNQFLPNVSIAVSIQSLVN